MADEEDKLAESGPDLRTPSHELVRSELRPLEPGERVDRYVIVARLGAGGMGVVHAAHDPELDRKLALKLLRSDRYPSTQASRRLLREAQALARLAHPNVVAIHDVGVHDGQVWLAMEFVSGRTLRDWLDAGDRSWSESLAVIVSAGRGLAAAHERGLFHRDIKPDNLMVDDSGRVRVTDFGLARLATDTEESNIDQLGSHGPTPAEHSLTGQGMLIGTPAYMAPELFLGYEADARSDQFSFCVTLWEALFGERPFLGRTALTLESEISEGRRRPTPRRPRAPVWLRRACERGLCADPEQRWPSMAALLDELERGRARAARRRLGLGVALIALSFAGVAGWRQIDEARDRAACARSGAEIEPLWNPSVRARVEAALRETGAPNVEATIERLTPALDAWATRWAALSEQSCVEAMVAGTRAPTLAGRSRACLADQRELFAGVLEVLANPKPTSVHRALPAVTGLPNLARCLDARVLERRPTLPADPGQREQFMALRRAAMRLDGHLAAGDYERGLGEAEQLLVRAEALDYSALATKIRATQGELGRLLGELERAEQALTRAYVDAGVLRDDELAAHLAIRLAILVGHDRDRRDEGYVWTNAADMLVRRLGEQHSPLGADLLAVRAHLDLGAGAYAAAERGYEQALEISQGSYGPDHPEVAEALNGLAMVFDQRGDYDRAQPLYERALAIRERNLGPEHPTVAASLYNLGIVHSRRGDAEVALALHEHALQIWEASGASVDVAMGLTGLGLVHKSMGHYAEARAHLERALEIRERELGPDHRTVAQLLNTLANLDRAAGDYESAQLRLERTREILAQSLGLDHPDVATVCNSLGELYRARGDYEAARELHEQALAIRERALGPSHATIANSLSNLALISAHDGDYERARSLNLRALEMRERELGSDHSAVATSLNNLAEVELELGALDDAEAHYRGALELMQLRLGTQHVHLSYPLHGLGRVASARGHDDEAVELLSRSLELREARGAAPSDRAEVRFALAQALWSAGDRAAGRTAGTQAADEYRESERLDQLAGVEAWLAGVEAWLAERARPITLSSQVQAR